MRILIKHDRYHGYTQVLLQRRKWYGWSLVRKEKTNNPDWYVKVWRERYGVVEVVDRRYEV